MNILSLSWDVLEHIVISQLSPACLHMCLFVCHYFNKCAKRVIDKRFSNFSRSQRHQQIIFDCQYLESPLATQWFDLHLKFNLYDQETLLKSAIAGMLTK